MEEQTHGPWAPVPGITAAALRCLGMRRVGATTSVALLSHSSPGMPGISRPGVGTQLTTFPLQIMPWVLERLLENRERRRQRRWSLPEPLIHGLSGFALASAVAGAAQSFTVLVGARAVLGAFAAMLAPADRPLPPFPRCDHLEPGREQQQPCEPSEACVIIDDQHLDSHRSIVA